VKVGDLVKLTAALKPRLGVVIGFEHPGWVCVLRLNGDRAVWPITQMELINESR
jgi:hypothetical protein